MINSHLRHSDMPEGQGQNPFVPVNRLLVDSEPSLRESQNDEPESIITSFTLFALKTLLIQV